MWKYWVHERDSLFALRSCPISHCQDVKYEYSRNAMGKQLLGDIGKQALTGHCALILSRSPAPKCVTDWSRRNDWQSRLVTRCRDTGRSCRMTMAMRSGMIHISLAGRSRRNDFISFPMLWVSQTSFIQLNTNLAIFPVKWIPRRSLCSRRCAVGKAIHKSSCGSEQRTDSSSRWRPMKVWTHSFVNIKWWQSCTVRKNTFSVIALSSWKKSVSSATSENSTSGVNIACHPKGPGPEDLAVSSCEPYIDWLEWASQAMLFWLNGLEIHWHTAGKNRTNEICKAFAKLGALE
jgi:hypothetical protein